MDATNPDPTHQYPPPHLQTGKIDQQSLHATDVNLASQGWMTNAQLVPEQHAWVPQPMTAITLHPDANSALGAPMGVPVGGLVSGYPVAPVGAAEPSAEPMEVTPLQLQQIHDSHQRMFADQQHMAYAEAMEYRNEAKLCWDAKLEAEKRLRVAGLQIQEVESRVGQHVRDLTDAAKQAYDQMISDESRVVEALRSHALCEVQEASKASANLVDQARTAVLTTQDQATASIDVALRKQYHDLCSEASDAFKQQGVRYEQLIDVEKRTTLLHEEAAAGSQSQLAVVKDQLDAQSKAMYHAMAAERQEFMQVSDNAMQCAVHQALERAYADKQTTVGQLELQAGHQADALSQQIGYLQSELQAASVSMQQQAQSHADQVVLYHQEIQKTKDRLWPKVVQETAAKCNATQLNALLGEVVARREATCPNCYPNPMDQQLGLFLCPGCIKRHPEWEKRCADARAPPPVAVAAVAAPAGGGQPPGGGGPTSRTLAAAYPPSLNSVAVAPAVAGGAGAGGDGGGGGGGGPEDDGDDEWEEEGGEEEEGDFEPDEPTEDEMPGLAQAGPGEAAPPAMPTRSPQDLRQPLAQVVTLSDGSTLTFAGTQAPKSSNPASVSLPTAEQPVPGKKKSDQPPPLQSSASEGEGKEKKEKKSKKSKKDKKEEKKEKKRRKSRRGRGRSSSSSASASNRGSGDSWCGSKDKEHSSIEMREMPDFKQLEAWKMALLESVVACANRGDPKGVIKWFMECYVKTFEELGECPRKYMRLDNKLTHALNKILKGTLGRNVQIRKQERLRGTGDQLLRGRQVYKLILEDFRSGQRLGRYYSTLDLEKLAWCGDAIEQLQRFRSNIEEIEAGLSDQVPDSERLEIYLDRMEGSKVLELKLDWWKEMKLDDPKRTKESLLAILDNYLETQKVKSNRKKRIEAFSANLKDSGSHNKPRRAQLAASADDNPADPSATLKAGVVKSQAVCQAYLRGQCRKSKKDCPYAHPEDLDALALRTSQQNRGRDRKPGGGGAREGTPPRGKKKYCWNMEKSGTCSFGANCSFSHDPKDKPKSRSTSRSASTSRSGSKSGSSTSRSGSSTSNNSNRGPRGRGRAGGGRRGRGRRGGKGKSKGLSASSSSNGSQKDKKEKKSNKSKKEKKEKSKSRSGSEKGQPGKHADRNRRRREKKKALAASGQ